MEWRLCVQILAAQHSRVEIDHVWPFISSHWCNRIGYHIKTIIVTTSATNPRRTNSKTRALIFEFDYRDWRDQMHEVLKSMLSSENAILHLYLVGGGTCYCTSRGVKAQSLLHFTISHFGGCVRRADGPAAVIRPRRQTFPSTIHTRVRYGPCHMARVLWQ